MKLASFGAVHMSRALKSTRLSILHLVSELFIYLFTDLPKSNYKVIATSKVIATAGLKTFQQPKGCYLRSLAPLRDNGSSIIFEEIKVIYTYSY